jgi:hypothetical protein
MALGEALAPCLEPRTLRRTVRIAVLVGCVLTAINESDVLAEGNATALTGVKIGLNFVVPFIVSNLGVLAGRNESRKP